jgi:hypothetical protein
VEKLSLLTIHTLKMDGKKLRYPLCVKTALILYVKKEKIMNKERVNTLKMIRLAETFDSCELLYIVEYKKPKNETARQYLTRCYTADWNCSHSYDCCGCWAYFVQTITFIAKNVAAVRVKGYKNV